MSLDMDDADGRDDRIARLLRLAGPRPPVPEERMARVRDAVRDRWRDAVRSGRRRRVTVLIAAQLAAAALLAVAVGTGFWLRGRMGTGGDPVAAAARIEGRVRLGDGRAVAPGNAVAAGAVVVTGAGGRAALRLGGGASVRLDVGTRLRLITAGVLELQRGAVYVDTGARPSEQTPIEIRTALGRVRDIGTQFQVRLAADGLRLSVREGTAALARDDRTYTAPAGSRLQVHAGGGVESGTVPLRGPEWDWALAIAPPFTLEGRTLRDYLEWLARETGWTVGYADPSIAAGAAAIILHGSTSGLRPDETPSAVLPTCGLVHRLEDGTLIVERSIDTGRP